MGNEIMYGIPDPGIASGKSFIVFFPPTIFLRVTVGNFTLMEGL